MAFEYCDIRVNGDHSNCGEGFQRFLPCTRQQSRLTPIRNMTRLRYFARVAVLKVESPVPLHAIVKGPLRLSSVDRNLLEC